MLAGPRAFGALGTTVAGIMFAILALFGGYLARRITTKDDAEVPRIRSSLARAISARRRDSPRRKAPSRLPSPRPRRRAAIARGELFPHDAELEAEAPEAGVSEPVPLGTVEFGDR